MTKLIDGVRVKQLKVIPDERGFLMEMLRSDDEFYQKFGREKSPTHGLINEFFMGERNPILVVIPPLVLHGMKGIGPTPGFLINIPTELYNYTEPDEFRVHPHDNDVPYDWDRKDG